VREAPVRRLYDISAGWKLTGRQRNLRRKRWQGPAAVVIIRVVEKIRAFISHASGESELATRFKNSRKAFALHQIPMMFYPQLEASVEAWHSTAASTAV
jgi:hypothetical protein